MSVMNSLPGRALSLTTINALDAADRIDMCKPLLGHTNSPEENVIAVYLDVSGTTRLVGYDPNVGWSVLESFSTGSDMSVMDAATDRVFDWAFNTYSQDDITVLKTETGTLTERVLALFPDDEPVGREFVEEIDTLPDVNCPGVGFCMQQTHEIIALHLIAEETAFSVGKNPESGSWEVVDETSMWDSNADGVGAALSEWVFAQYDNDDVQAVVPQKYA